MSRAPSVCATPTCPNLVETGGKCEECRAKEPRHKRPSLTDRGYPPDWYRKRAKFLKTHKKCECDDCLLTPVAMRPDAAHVDHIVAVSDGGSSEPSNLRAMAHGHHSKRTGRDQPGGFNAFQQRDRVRGRVQQANPDRSQRRTGGC